MYCYIHRCHYHRCNCVPIDSKEKGEALTQEELLAYTQEMKEELKDYTVDLKDQIFSYIDIGLNPVEINNSINSLKEQDTYILRTLTNNIDELNNTTNLSMYNLRTKVIGLEGQNASIIQDLISLPFENGVLADTFVTATANGVDTIARTQRDVNSDTKSIKDFINAKLANDFAENVGGKVFIPNGNYTTAADLDMTNFWGSGVITNTENNKVFSRPDSEYVMPEFFGITDEDATEGMHAALDKGYVRLKSGRTYKVNGTYSINGDITIDGNNATLVGSDNVAMQVFADCTITLKNLTVSGFSSVVKNTGNFKVKIDFQGCDFTDCIKIIDFNTAGSLSFNLKDNKFSRMYSAVWAQCAIKGSLAEYNEFTDMANDHTSAEAEHMSAFRLGGSDNLNDSGLIVFRNNIFKNIKGGSASQEIYVAAIFACVRQLVCYNNEFDTITGVNEGGREHRSRAIYSYGYNDKIVNNFFNNSGEYQIITIKGDLATKTQATTIVSGNTIHQDLPLKSGGVTFDVCYNVIFSDNTWTGNYANVTFGGSGAQFGSVVCSGNTFDVLNSLVVYVGNTTSFIMSNNTLKRISKIDTAADNIITVINAAPYKINNILIKDNIIDVVDFTPLKSSSPRSFIVIKNATEIDSVVIRGNTLHAEQGNPISLSVDDVKSSLMVWQDNIMTNTAVPEVVLGSIISSGNIYDGVLETPEPPETPEPTP